MTPGRRSDSGSTVATSLKIGGDRTVRRLGFGAMRLVSEPSEARERSIAVARRAVDLGVNLIDTALMYGWGQNELLLREALHPYPEDLLIATKVGIIQPGAGKWAADGRPASLKRQTEDSLHRLGIERIGLLQLHRIDSNVPFADQLGALMQLQQSGKVAHIGLSEISASDLVFATDTMAIASVQNRYGIIDRTSEAVLKLCTDMGIAFLPWRPVATSNEAAAIMTAEAKTLIKTMDSIADELKATRTQIALAWLLHHSPVILPIPGTFNMIHLQENIAAAKLSLDVTQMRQLSL